MDDFLHSNDVLIRYLDDDLTNEEKLALEEKLPSDTELQQELDNLKIAIQAVLQFGTTAQVSAIHQQMMTELKGENKSKVVRIRKTIRLTLAVAATILALFIGFRFFMNTRPSAEKIYKEAFVSFTLSTTRGTVANGSQIEQLYQQNNYTAVTTVGRSRLLSAKDSLLIGLSYLYTEKAGQATLFFQGLAAGNSDFKQDAEFYLSLSCLKEKNYERASRLMKKIAAEPAHLYYQQITTDILEDVEALNKK